MLDVSSEPPSRTKKSVRIESPVETIPPHTASRYAGDELYRSSGRGHHAGSPPPEASPVTADEFEEIHPQDPAESDAERRTVLGNTWKSSEALPSVLPTSGAPANPFARTLATIESQEGGGNPAVLPRGLSSYPVPVPYAICAVTVQLCGIFARHRNFMLADFVKSRRADCCGKAHAGNQAAIIKCRKFQEPLDARHCQSARVRSTSSVSSFL